MRVATASPADWSGFSPYKAVQIIYFCPMLGIKLPEIIKKMLQIVINQMVLTALANASWNSKCSQAKQSLKVLSVSAWLVMLICSHLTNVVREQSL